MHRSRTKSTQPTNQLINAPENLYSKENDSQSRPKSSTKNTQYQFGQHKSSKSLQYHSAFKPNLPDVSNALKTEQKFQICKLFSLFRVSR